MKTTAKSGITQFIKECLNNGLNQFVCSPGSRNAPIIIALDEHPDVKTIVIHDERSAAFYALGMALELKSPVAVVCTSGSAMLNYYPAVAEAYYQSVPLVIISADRPSEWINQGDGQTIVQTGVYVNHIHSEKTISEIESNELIKDVNEAFDIGNGDWKGPIHFNCPLSEPLYEVKEIEYINPEVRAPKLSNFIFENNAYIENKWINSSKKLVLVGQMNLDERLKNFLIHLSGDGDVAVLVENTSNLTYSKFIDCIDRTLTNITEDEITSFQPDLLITLGGAIISKKIKQFLRESKLVENWNVGYEFPEMDTYQSLTKSFQCKPSDFIEELLKIEKPIDISNYGSKWKQKDFQVQSKIESYLPTLPFSDLKVFETVLDFMPDETNLHMSNSSVVRYCQLFNSVDSINYYCNRGTSGIDGSTSTAFGIASMSTEKLNVLITGDISFFYDSNALWNNKLPSNLKVILINNGGGGIFRFIDGPSKTDQLEDYFEAKHNFKAEHICKAFNVEYNEVNDLKELESIIQDFLNSTETGSPSLLEINTPSDLNGEVLKSYFNFIRN